MKNQQTDDFQCLILYSLHDPKVGKTQYLQGCFLQELQNSAQDLPQRSKPGNNVIVRAEDNGAFNKANGQIGKQLFQVFF